MQYDWSHLILLPLFSTFICRQAVPNISIKKPIKTNIDNAVSKKSLQLSSSGSSLTSWLTPTQVYKKSREDPKIGSVMGWSTTTTHTTCQSGYKGCANIFVHPLRLSEKFLFYVKTLNQTKNKEKSLARAGEDIKANFNSRHLKCITWWN